MRWTEKQCRKSSQIKLSETHVWRKKVLGSAALKLEERVSGLSLTKLGQDFGGVIPTVQHGLPTSNIQISWKGYTTSALCTNVCKSAPMCISPEKRVLVKQFCTQWEVTRPTHVTDKGLFIRMCEKNPTYKYKPNTRQKSEEISGQTCHKWKERILIVKKKNVEMKPTRKCHFAPRRPRKIKPGDSECVSGCTATRVVTHRQQV